LTYLLEDVTTDPVGTDIVYEPGRTRETTTYAIRVHTDARVTGEYDWEYVEDNRLGGRVYD